MNQRWARYATFGQTVVAFGVVLLGLVFARYVLATLFRAYDDEGYFMLALTRYLRPGPLDPETFSHYGPFYYYAQQAAFRLFGLAVTHDAARLVTLLDWTACALLGGVYVYRISRSLLLGAAATLAGIQLCVVLASEPGHPQQVVVVLFTLAGCLSLPAGSSRWTVSMFLLGAVGAALVFTKINVGAFYLAAIAHALVCVLPSSRLRTAGIAVLLAYAILAPLLVARSHLLTGSGGFCLVAALCTGATFAWGALARPDPSLDSRRAWLAIAGAMSAALLIAIAVLSQGVSLAALFQGVVVAPFREPSGLLYLGFRLGLVPCLFTVIVTAGIAGLSWFGERLAPYQFWVGALRCGVGLGSVILLVRTDLSWVVPFLPLGVIPAAGRRWSASEWFPRLFIADLAAAQFLMVYPTAGSHVSIASVPVLLWAFLLFCDGVAEVTADKRSPSRAQWHAAAGAFIVLVVAAGMSRSGMRWTGYPYPPSGLKGAASLHLPPQQAETYRFLSGTITANCSVLFTLPRLGSFNFWSGVPAPPASNATLQMKVFPWARQKPVLDLLQSDPRSCVLYHRELVEFWQLTPRELARMPLTKYILSEMPVAQERDGYQIRINPHRNSPWVAARGVFP